MQADYIGGLTGGLLIGIAALFLLATVGRIAGISGILAGIYENASKSERHWRIIFLIGLLSGAGLVSILSHGLLMRLQTDGLLLMLAGLLVGMGTRLGGGCTSGHGVCGLSRRSKRSFFATLTFIGFGMLTVYVIRHLIT